MTLNEITEAMQAYKNLRNQQGLSEMQNLYNQGNCFPYLRDPNNQPVKGGSQAFVHAYPGVVSGQLVFFVISAYLDTSSTANIENYVEVCSVKELTPSATTTGSGMPVDEALGRINNWRTNKTEWIQANITTIFQGFCIPQGDTAYGNQHNSFFSLIPDNNAPGQFTAEVIVEDVAGQSFEYFDTSKPVPPFPPSTGEYYLLSLV